MSAQQYGYIRVSSRDQNEDRQRIAMREFGILVLFVFFRTIQSKKHKNHTETTSLSARRFLSHFVKIIPFFASRKAPLSVIENKIGIITR